MQLDTLSQMMNAHHELNVKDIDISTLKMQNEQLQNDLRREKEIEDSFKKSREAINHFEQLLKSPRSSNDTSGLGFTSTEECETSKSVEKRSDMGKNSKPTCHFCSKKGHTANVCRSRKTNQQDTPKNKGYCHKCNVQGNLTQDCRTKVIRITRFDCHCYNYNMHGHRGFECRSKPMWTSNQPVKTKSHGHHYNWD